MDERTIPLFLFLFFRPTICDTKIFPIFPKFEYFEIWWTHDLSIWPSCFPYILFSILVPQPATQKSFQFSRFEYFEIWWTNARYLFSVHLVLYLCDRTRKSFQFSRFESYFEIHTIPLLLLSFLRPITKIFPIFKIRVFWNTHNSSTSPPFSSSHNKNLSNFQDSNRILKHDERTIPFPFPPHLILLHTTPLHTHRTYDIYENLPKIRVFRNAVAERTIPLTAVINDAQYRRTLKKPIRGMISRWKILRRSRYFPFFLNPLSKIIASTYTHDNTR